MALSSWGAPCSGQKRTVTTRGWSFDLKRREDVRVSVRAELAPLYAYLARSAVEGGYRLRNGACWGYACRKVRGGSSWSGHSWAGAWDWNSDRNPMVKRKSSDDFDPRVTDMPPWLVLLCESWGVTWGGRWKRTVDGMHFQTHNELTIAELNRLGKIATGLFAEGRFGCGPDGAPIPGFPGATPSPSDDIDEIPKEVQHMMYRHPNGRVYWATPHGALVWIRNRKNLTEIAKAIAEPGYDAKVDDAQAKELARHFAG